MKDSDYVSAVALYYLCDSELAKIIIKSAEENGTISELDRIVYGNSDN